MANERVAQSYEVEIEAAKERLNESLAAASADAVVIAEAFDRPLMGVVRDITADAPEMFDRVYDRAGRLSRKARSETDSRTGGQAPSQSQSHHVKSARSAIKKHPELAAELLADPEVSAALHQAQTESIAQRREQSAQRKSADPVGRKFDERVALHDLQAEVNKFVKVAVELIPEIGLIPEAERFWLKGEAERLEYVASELRYMAEYGETRTDSELRAITEAG